MAVNFIQNSQLPTRWGMFQLHGFYDDIDEKEHIVLSLGSMSTVDPVLVRISFVETKKDADAHQKLGTQSMSP